eukprot:403371542
MGKLLYSSQKRKLYSNYSNQPSYNKNKSSFYPGLANNSTRGTYGSQRSGGSSYKNVNRQRTGGYSTNSNKYNSGRSRGSFKDRYYKEGKSFGSSKQISNRGKFRGKTLVLGKRNRTQNEKPWNRGSKGQRFRVKKFLRPDWKRANQGVRLSLKTKGIFKHKRNMIAKKTLGNKSVIERRSKKLQGSGKMNMKGQKKNSNTSQLDKELENYWVKQGDKDNAVRHLDQDLDDYMLQQNAHVI